MTLSRDLPPRKARNTFFTGDPVLDHGSALTVDTTHALLVEVRRVREPIETQFHRESALTRVMTAGTIEVRRVTS
jgi:hypothetical protein